MLILSRKENEEFQLGESVRIKTLEIGPEIIQLEIISPEELPISLFQLPEEQSRFVFADYNGPADKHWKLKVCVGDWIYLAGDVRLLVVKIKDHADYKAVWGVEFPDGVSFSRGHGE